ncbi:MAG: hypothetical protein Tsb002_13760 [Wenzhouxiangellaceae bacterium]
MLYDPYEEAAELISMLKNTHFQDYGSAIQCAMDEGATGTEIFMALRRQIEKLLAEPLMNDVIKAKARRLLSEVDEALE